MKRTLLTTSICILFIELISIIFIKFVASEKIKKWRDYDLPQRISTLTWFDKENSYHPFLTYYGEDFKESLSSSNIKSESTVSIAILGGSFAHSFAIFLNTPRGKKVLNAFNNKLGINHNVNILDFSSGGYRHPQQLIASVLYLEKADIFLSIEGFNELVLKPQNPCYPRTWNQQFHRFSPEESSLWVFLGKMTKTIYLASSQLSTLGSSSIQLLFYSSENLLLSLIHFFQSKQLSHSSEKCKKETRKINKTSLVNYWLNDIKKHHQVMNSAGKPLITVMQPNQYKPSSKIWTTDEKKIFSTFNERKKNVGEIYQQASEKFSSLAQTNSLPLLNYTDIYKNESKTVYIDGCCHVNDLGNAILSEKLFTDLLSIIDWKNIISNKSKPDQP